MSDQTLGEEPRTYFIGGDNSAARWITPRRVWQVLGALALLVAVVGTVSITQSLLVLAAWAGSIGLGFLLLRRRDRRGAAWAGSLAERLRATLAYRLGWDAYDPEIESSPCVLGRVSVLAPSATENSPELAVIDHRDERVFTTVLRIEGGGDGLHEIWEGNQRQSRFGQLLRTIANDNNLPVNQLDMLTHAVPATGREYRRHIEAELRSDLPEAVAESMAALGDLVSERSEGYSSYVVLRLPVDDLADRCRADLGEVSDEGLAETAFLVTGEVGLMLEEAGYPALPGGVPPRSLGALIRHLYLPSRSADDLEGVDRTLDGFPAFAQARDGRSVISFDEQAGITWHHAIGDVPTDGWPLDLVPGRLLSQLIVEAPPGLYRTVVSQFRLLPQHVAVGRARGALTSARAGVISQNKRGVVSTGVPESREDAASLVLSDVGRGQHAGVLPMVRMLVSAPSAPQLQRARNSVQTLAASTGFAKWRWRDGRHAQAMMTCLPLGRGIAGV